MNVFAYSADEVVKTAIEIEKRASSFYREAAEKAKRHEMGTLFTSLSTMETDHARIFGEMEGEMSEQERGTQLYDPGNEMLYFLRDMSGIHAWEGKGGPDQPLSGEESPQEVISIALRAEHEGISFYTFLKDYVPRSTGKDRVDRIIREEMRHVAALNRYMGWLQDGAQGPPPPPAV
jgi:rubrerythrin